MNSGNPDFSSNLAALLRDMEAARAKSGLSAPSVTLVGASKTVSADRLETAINSGIRHFGENRVQEAQEKWPALKKNHPDVRLHLIGPLQTNKAADALALFDIIETLDREKLVDVIAKEIAGQKIPIVTREYFVQVNTGNEPQKSGVSLDGADALIAYAKQKGLNVTGLMCVPPAGENPGPHFAMLREIALRNNLPSLSMGMSGDYQTAIQFGATHIRIGSALFGERSA